MSRYDERYEIRLANVNDIEAIMDFIDKEWKKDHVLATSRELFEYEFLEENGDVNFIIAIDRESKQIAAIIGFLKASHDEENMDIWGSIWKVTNDALPLLGVEIIKRKMQITSCRNDITVGSSDVATKLYKTALRRHVDTMKHYYRLADRDANAFVIATVNNKTCANVDAPAKKGKVRLLNNIEELQACYDLTKNKLTVPYKDVWYINHRYFNHIAYKYNVCAIEVDDVVEAIFIYRIQRYQGKNAIRIMDYIGNQMAFGTIKEYFDELLADPDNEYIDFYCLGMDEIYLNQAGFVKRDENDSNIIPNYFSPFVSKNIDIVVNSTDPNTMYFKADADQDRPNKL